ncbi:MAG: Sporulation related protein [Proteobacteria bacterium]|nr:Sporulation related protein [Pseudomonadota bacterium]
MVDKPEVAENEDSAADLRNKLIKRLAVAGVLVAVLLGVLAFFDYLATPPEEPEEEVYSKPVPVGPKKPLSQPVTPTSELPEPPSTAPVVAEEAPAPPQPAPASEEKVDKKSEKGEAKPQAARQDSRSVAPPPVSGKAPTVAAPALPAAPTIVPALPAQPSSVGRTPRAVPESSVAPSELAGEGRPTPPAAKPSARVVEARPAPVVPPSGMARLFSGFLLQAGVFTSPQRAEELHAKLTLSGVPSTLETRVQVGPFRTRQEAEAAQLKLRELGIETVLLPPKEGRR